MSPPRQADPDLDTLIWEITADAHDEDEQPMGFENAVNEANLPCPATVLGEAVQVLSASTANNRHEPIATCQRNDRHYDIALLDIDLKADSQTSRLIAAYRRWTGA
jgi:hypothetical protein